jgi:hypothetical protein
MGVRFNLTQSCCGVKEGIGFSWTTAYDVTVRCKELKTINPPRYEALIKFLDFSQEELATLKRWTTRYTKTNGDFYAAGDRSDRSWVKYTVLSLMCNVWVDMKPDAPSVFRNGFYTYQIYWAQRTFTSRAEKLFVELLKKLGWKIIVLGPSQHTGNGNLRTAIYAERKTTKKSADYLTKDADIFVASGVGVSVLRDPVVQPEPVSNPAVS